MCGIAGFIRLTSGSRCHAPVAERMANAMRRRGPDDEGYLIAFRDNRRAQPFVGQDSVPNLVGASIGNKIPHIREAYQVPADMFFAHRRLAIVDLSHHGHQPMATPDGRYWIIYNGEIYNFKEVAEELRSLGERFDSNCDTEVLLRAHARWGADALRRFNGMFAYAVWDDVEKTLFCARDRVGIKPFYYLIEDGWLLFASDIKTLIASGIYAAAPDIEGLFYGLSYGVAPRPLTAFEDVRALPQGHWMKVGQAGSLSIQEYWRPPIGISDPGMSEEDSVRLLRDTLDRAVERRLVADVPVGTFMSGGVDSTTISAIAATHQPGIKALTLGFEGGDPQNSELDEARACAALHPMTHVIRMVRPDDVLSSMGEVIRCFEEPAYPFSPNFLISKLASENGVKVVLNGLGGDELFAGYGRYSAISRWRSLRRLGCLRHLIPPLTNSLVRDRKIAAVASADRLHSVLMSQWTDEEKRKLFRDPAVKAFNTVEKLRELYVRNDDSFADDLEAMGYLDLMSYIGNHHVYRVDQFTMHFSIEGRLPFLDHEVIEAACRIPGKFKIKGKERKYVLRKVAAPIVHPSNLVMAKKRFSIPFEQWIEEPWIQKMAREQLRSLRQRDLVDGDEVGVILGDLEAGSANANKVYRLISLELWMKAFIDNSDDLGLSLETSSLATEVT